MRGAGDDGAEDDSGQVGAGSGGAPESGITSSTSGRSTSGAGPSSSSAEAASSGAAGGWSEPPCGGDCPDTHPVAPDETHFGWQTLVDRIEVDGSPCHTAITVALGDRVLCYAGADDRLYCAGGVYDIDFGPRFVDVGVDGPLQVIVSPTSNSDIGNWMCAVLRDGTAPCVGVSDWGQLGNRNQGAVGELTAWDGRTDVVRFATGTSDQNCVLTSSGETWCAGAYLSLTPVLEESGSAVWVDVYGAPHVDDPTVFRASAGRTECVVGRNGLTCQGRARATSGRVVDGGIFARAEDDETEGDRACWLDDSGRVACFDVEGGPEVASFTGGPVLAIALNYYNEARCAVYADGSLWCIGPNRYGELGTGDTSPVLVETEVAPPGSVRVACE